MSATRHLTVGKAGLVVVMKPEALRRACAKRGWSLTELCGRAGISRPTLAQALRGEAVRPRTAFKLSRALSDSPVAPVWDSLMGAP
jgi:transcriptional regulator with XRE-family HTH domain